MSGLFINLFAVEIQTGRQKDIKLKWPGLHISPPPTHTKKLTISLQHSRWRYEPQTLISLTRARKHLKEEEQQNQTI